MYDPAISINLNPIPWTQSPPCDYVVSETLVWTDVDSTFIFVNPFDSLQLSVQTIAKANLGDHTITITNNIEYGGSSWSPSYFFTITIVDPCETTTLNTQTINTLTTDNGVVGVVEFTDITDSEEVARGQDTLCGDRSYTISYQDDTAIDWVTVAPKAGEAGVYEITADPTLDEHQGTKNLKLGVTLDNYPSHAGLEINFNVVIVTPACEC